MLRGRHSLPPPSRDGRIPAPWTRVARPRPYPVGLMEGIFSEVCRGTANVAVVKTAGFGDKVCEFYVHLKNE
jgi:hypothetical protein